MPLMCIINIHPPPAVHTLTRIMNQSLELAGVDPMDDQKARIDTDSLFVWAWPTVGENWAIMLL
jgi:hypothetical protein